MIEILNHFYYSVYSFFHWFGFLFIPQTKETNKNIVDENKFYRYVSKIAENDAQRRSFATYTIFVGLYFLVLYVAIRHDLSYKKAYIDTILFFLCVLLGYFVCYYASFKNDKYKTYFKKFEKRDAVTRFWWHFLSFLEICLLILGFYLVL